MYKKIVSSIALISLLAFSVHASAQNFEITPLVGQSMGSDLVFGSSDVSTSTGTNIGLGIAWQDTPNGQGQVLINFVNHDFTSGADDSEQSLDILYAHFNGIGQFKEHGYITTMSIGLGGAQFKTDHGQEVYPSATIAVGTQYEINERINFVTEIRGYATLIDNEDNLFCEQQTCHAEFEGNLYKEASVSIGISIKF